jgi:hypothetical protein
MRFVMLLCGDESAWFEGDQSVADAAMKEIGSWFEKWQPAGKIADGGAELDSSRKAKTVSRGPDGGPLVTDGPYLELKEVVGGFITLDADDIDEAVAIASEWPTIASHGDKVEVRPVIER